MSKQNLRKVSDSDATLPSRGLQEDSSPPPSIPPSVAPVAAATFNPTPSPTVGTTSCNNQYPNASIIVDGKMLYCDDPELKCDALTYGTFVKDLCCKCKPQCCNKCASNDQSVCPTPTAAPVGAPPRPTWLYRDRVDSSPTPTRAPSPYYYSRPAIDTSNNASSGLPGNAVILFAAFFILVTLGCICRFMSQEKVPDGEAFKVAHEPEPVFAASNPSSSSQFIGSHVGAGPSTGTPIRLKMKEKFFSWSQDSFKIKNLATDGPFGNGIQVKGQAWSSRDEMALLDGTGQMLAVCRKKFEFGVRAFKIYVPRPVMAGQSPSQQRYNGQSLYTYCEVRREMMNGIKAYLETDKHVVAYDIKRGQTMFGKTRIIKKKGTPAALVEGRARQGIRDTYEIKVNPGIDPCLIICICAICDEMDEK